MTEVMFCLVDKRGLGLSTMSVVDEALSSVLVYSIWRLGQSSFLAGHPWLD